MEPKQTQIKKLVLTALIVEHDLRQVIARNCRQRNGSICGRTGSLFFPGIPQHQQGKHAACQQDDEREEVFVKPKIIEE